MTFDPDNAREAFGNLEPRDRRSSGSAPKNHNPEGNTSVQKDTPAALFFHCENIYEAMFNAAHKVHIADGEDMLVYEGILTKLFQDMNFSSPYYSTVTKKLKDMGCVRQLRRGGGGSPSQWQVLTKPTKELFDNPPFAKRGVSQRQSRIDQLEHQVNNLNTRLASLEENFSRLAQAVANNTTGSD